MLTPTNDIELWQLLLAGDDRSFQQVYRSHFSMLYEYGMRFSDEEDFVKECIQQLFVKIWTNKDSLAAVTKIKPYLLFSLRAIIYNKFRDEKRRRINGLEEDYDFELEFSPEASYIEREVTEKKLAALKAAMEQLTPRQKEIIYLRYFQELDYKEIAAVMDVSVKGAYKLSARSLEALREIMDISLITLICLLKIAASR
ncbi:RNA polymerase sigma factor, sigma-70 family [Chitinophaga jiangningensis]|uniref:RNA polymerase sigma factor, sigma-70 family n=1 Tax=Chitinophaga jiangningensis TaxID=1419482 RepID=A0A1M6YVL6_9BACT|nr:RNA polymerase sigma factor [Chitinophaga jiangningensis]SHL22247.1 RNA polymerase sigma factor, sigma-70 family [Chitinophaga jiangningensis]